MSAVLNRKDWKEQAAILLKQISSSKLEIATMFPNKEHVILKEAPSSALRENLHKFFSKRPDSLVQVETLSTFLKQTPPDIIQEGDKVYKELKRIQQQTLYVQLQAKGFLDSKEKTYSHTKLIMGDMYAGGVGYPEAEKLKAILDENRSIERTLATNFISMEQLEELEGRLKAEKSVIDQSFGKLISEKKAQFETLNNQLMQLLSKNSLKPNELRRICEILELAESIKFNVNHHRHVKDIRDSFRWTHLLELFFSQPELTIQKFNELAEKIGSVDTKKHLDFEKLKQKLTLFAETVEGKSDIGIFQVLLGPVKDIESTDPSIQSLIDAIRNSFWTINARHKINTKSISAEELEALFKQAPTSKKTSQETTYLKVKELYQQMRLADNQLVLLLKEMREFMADVNEEKIKSEDGKQKISSFNKKMHELLHIYDVRLTSIEGLKKTERFLMCEGILTILNCSFAICFHKYVSPEKLESAEVVFEAEDEALYKDNDLLLRVYNCITDKKIVDEFLLIVDQPQGEDSTLGDKVDIRTARKYIEIMKSEENPISYTTEIYRIDSYVERFEAWEERCLKFIEYYSIEQIEADFQRFVREELSIFESEYEYLTKELKELHFYSDSVSTLQALKFSVDSLLFFSDKAKKKDEWEDLMSRGEDSQEAVPERYYLVCSEIEKATTILEVIGECSKERPSYLSIRKLRELLPNCCIDLSEELAPCLARMEEEENLSEKIDQVLNSEHKSRITELERINEDIRTSQVTFEDLGRRVEHSYQICKSFMMAVRDMKKEARDIKKAAQLYLSLPLFSPSFESILLQLIEEEDTLEELETLLAGELDVQDFDMISAMESKLALIKYYDAERPKIILFKKKITLLAKISRTGEMGITLPYLVVKSMKVECHDLCMKFDNDEELELMAIFLADVDNETSNYLNMVINTKPPISGEKLKKTIMNFVDISNDLIDIQSKAKGKGLLSASQAVPPLQPVKNGTGVKTLLPAKPIMTTPAVVAKAPEEIENLVIPSYLSTLAIKANGDHKPPDIVAMREGMAASLKIAWQKNSFTTETDGEWTYVAHSLERMVFTRAEQGTYVFKMQKLLKLVQNLTRLRRITTLVAAKKYNADLLMALMDLPNNTLIEIENDKDKLLKTLTQTPNGGVLGSNHPADLSVSEDMHSSKKKVEVEREKLGKRVADCDEIEEVSRERLEIQDNYRIAKIKHLQTEEPGKGMEDLLKDADRVVETLKDQLKSFNERRDVDMVSEGSRHDDQKDSYRIKKIKKDSEQKVQKEVQIQPKIEETASVGKIPELPAWSVYKGTITFEMRGLDGMVVQADYCDLITIESKSKVMNFPKLPEKLEVKGPFEHQDFVNQIEKLMKKPSKLFGFLFGILKSNDSVDNLVKSAVKSNCTFYSKFNQNTKLFILPKSMFNKNWHDSLDIGSRKIYHSNAELYWMIAHHINPADKGKPPVSTIDPHPIYTQNLFDLAAYQGR
jgi:hypothetical protein